MTIKFWKDERGVAMVVALLISFVVLLLSVFVVQLAIHDVNQSSYDRRRLLSVNAAEAGVNDYYAYLGGFLHSGASTANLLTTVQCSLDASVATGPNEASYHATVEFYDAGGSTVGCGDTGLPPADGVIPASVRITSIGQAPTGLPRTMESYAQLVPVYGGTTAAVLSNASTSLTQKVTVNGYDGSDADVYVNGNLTVSNNETFSGNLYVQGAISFTNSTSVDGNMWALNNVSMTPGASVVNGYVYSTNGSITINNPAVIYGDAKAKTTISGCITGPCVGVGQIRGTSYPNTSGIGNPPAQSFPSFPYDVSKWTNAGYQLATGAAFTSCAVAKTWIKANLPQTPITGTNYNYVVRVQPPAGSRCDMSFDSLDHIYLPGSLAILTDCGITMTNHPVFESVNGNHSLFLVSTGTSSSCSGGSKAITTSNQVDFLNLASPNRLDVFIYSVGQVTLANLNAMNGQVYGQPVTASNQTTINYVPVYVPGITTVTGFRQNVQYIREIPAT
jgi:cytoskeletal protein CcmA (bactofilin family)/uncharacterized Tic20 family protein